MWTLESIIEFARDEANKSLLSAVLIVVPLVLIALTMGLFKSKNHFVVDGRVRITMLLEPY
jgi:hypothetical protein